MKDTPLFAPANNFWHPHRSLQADAPDDWLKIWARCLSLGQRLLQDIFPDDVSNFIESFQQEAENIRQEIKEKLFIEKTTRPAMGISEAPDIEIHRILSNISEKWERNRKSPPSASEPEEETLTQTVMISMNKGQDHIQPPPLKIEEEIQETVIIKKNAPAQGLPSAPRVKPSPPAADMGNDEDDLAKTFILKPSEKKDLK